MFFSHKKFSLSLLAALFSGVLLALAFPGVVMQGHGLAFLLPVALVPLFAAIEALPTQNQSTTRSFFKLRASKITPFSRALQAFALMWIAGMVVAAFLLWWSVIPLIQFARFSYPAAYAVWLLSIPIAGLFLPVTLLPFVIEAARAARKVSYPLSPWILIALSVCIEYFLPPPFRLFLGGNYTFSPVFNQWISLFGVSILSLFILASNYVIAHSFFLQPRIFFRSLFTLLLVVFAWICIWGIGFWRFKVVEDQVRQFSIQKIGLVQSAYSFAERAWRPLQFPKTKPQSFENTLQLTRSLLEKEKVDLVVWPEDAIPENSLQKPEIREQLVAFAQEMQVPLLVQVTEEKPSGKWESYSLLIRSDGSFSKSYVKKHLYPFSEYIPGEKNFTALGNWIRKKLLRTKIWIEGQDVLPAQYYNPDFACGMMIGHDVYDFLMARELATEGSASFLVVQANFSWMIKTSASFLWLQQARLRAIETGRSLIFVSNSGPSVVFDPFGRITYGPTFLWKELAVAVNVYAQDNSFNFETFYTKFGDTPLFLLGIFALLRFLLQFKRKHR